MSLMWHYFEVLLGRSPAQINSLQERVAGGSTLQPMELKKDMASEVITRFLVSSGSGTSARKFYSAVSEKDFSKTQKCSSLQQFKSMQDS